MVSKDCVKAIRGQVFYYNPVWVFTGKNEKYNNHLLQGHVESKTRPYLVISNNDGNFTSACCNVIPITTREQISLPCQVKFQYERRSQVIMVEQVITANIKDLGGYLYTIDDYILEQVEAGLMLQFGIKDENFNVIFNDLYSKLQTIVNQVISNSKCQIENVKRRQLDDISLYLCESVEDMLIGSGDKQEKTKEFAAIKNMINLNDGNNQIRHNNSKEKNDLSPLPVVLSEILDSQDYIEILSKKRNKKVWDTDTCREFLRDCKTLKIEDVVVKYNFKNKRSVYDKRHYLKKKGIV